MFTKPAYLLCLAAMLLASASRAAADILTLESGEIILGELISETPDEVVFHGKIAGIWSKARFDRARVASVKREPGDQGPASERNPGGSTQAPEPARPSTKAPVAPPAGSAKPPASAAPAGEAGTPTTPAPTVVEVLVQGVGPTPKAAFDDAIRGALVQVAGAFIRSDSTLENEQLVQERIIAHSQGFIESAERIGAAELRDGSYHQRAKVRVRQGEIAVALRGGAAGEAEVDGVTLYARLRTLLDQRASAQQLLEVLFEDWPASVMEFEVVDGPKRTEAPIDGSSLGSSEAAFVVKVDLWIDPAKWRAWTANAHAVLGSIAERQQALDWSFARSGWKRIGPKTEWGVDFVQFVARFISRKAAAASHWVAQDDREKVNCFVALGKLLEAMRLQVQAVEEEDSLLAGASSRHRGSIVVLLDALDEAPRAYLLPTPELVFGQAEEDGLGVSLDADVFGAPSIDVWMLDGNGARLGRRVLPLTSFGYQLMPGTPEQPGAAFGEWSTDCDPFRVVCSPAMRTMDRGFNWSTPWGRSLLAAPALWSYRCKLAGEIVLSERMTMPIGFVLPVDAVASIARVDVKLGGRVGLGRSFRPERPR